MKISLLTLEKTVYEGEMTSLLAPGSAGSLGILKNHAPILTSLSPGVIELQNSGKKQHFFIGGGFLEFNNNFATILADSAESPKEIDLNRAKEAQKRANQRLKSKKEIDITRAEQSLVRSLARQIAYKKYGK
jgi:F-type H+-transporting ATPase subunit epsilon